MRIPDTFEKTAISVLLAALATLMLIAAFCRHLIPDYHPAVLKTASGTLAWMAFLGMARAAALGLHVRVSILEDAVSTWSRRRLALVADIVFLVFAIVTFAVGCVVFWLSLARDGLPGHPLIYAALPAGSLLTVVRLWERLHAAEGTGTP